MEYFVFTLVEIKTLKLWPKSATQNVFKKENLSGMRVCFTLLRLFIFDCLESPSLICSACKNIKEYSTLTKIVESLLSDCRINGASEVSHIIIQVP
jgi:hypothetical protein